MKINKNQIQYLLLLIVFLFGIYLWTSPIRGNPYPYGDVDATSHFSIADYMAQTDKPIVALPYYIDARYGHDNKFIPHRLWYAPQYHTNLAVMQIIGNERFESFYLWLSILSIAVILSVFFLIKRIYGFTPAILSSILLLFPLRNILLFIWGRQTELLAYAYLPLVFYCFYSYIGKKKPIYIYSMFLFLAMSFFFHPQVWLLICLSLFIMFLFVLIKDKKIVFLNDKHFYWGIVVFIVLIAMFPSTTGNVIINLVGGTADGGEIQTRGIGSLFSWANYDHNFGGFPAAFFSYSAMNGGIWSIPFLILGILYIFLSKNKKNWIMISWLVALYVFLHLDVFGFVGSTKILRFLGGESYLFYPLVCLGLVFILGLLKKYVRFKGIRYVNYIIIIIFILLIFNFSFKPANAQLNNVYTGIQRINEPQLMLSGWLMKNTPANSSLIYYGNFGYNYRWIRSTGHRYVMLPEHITNKTVVSYVIFDYSYLLLLGNQVESMVNQMRNIENNLYNITQRVYSKDNIRVYKIES